MRQRRWWRAAGRWSLAAGLLLALGCASARTFESGYPEVATALRQRFGRNEWTRQSTARGTIREQEGRLDCTYYEWEFPDVKVRCEITAKARGGGRTRVTVFVKDYDSWFSPFTYSPSWAHGVLDAIGQRLEGGRWEGMPWGGMALDPNAGPEGGTDGPATEPPGPGTEGLAEGDGEPPLLVPAG